MAGVDFDEALTTDKWPVNSSTRMISWVWRPGEASGRSWGSKLMTAPMEVAGGGWWGMVDGVGYGACPLHSWGRGRGAGG